jgi:hypothetical protein
VEELSPIEAKGKSERLAAFRLLHVGEPTRQASTPLVGRTAELPVALR